MDNTCCFNFIEEEELCQITGGCGFCIAGTILGCAATGVGIGGVAGSVPGAVIGGVAGTVVGIMIAF